MNDPTQTSPSASNQPASSAEAKWRPIPTVQRRALGVLVEKAKTTPDNYPLSLAATVSGCNQKSNRHPAMQLEPEDVEEALDRLRELGAVGLIEGHGRVSKYRHYFYQWLGVDKVEAAVMAELLLRGPQTEGELRGRAARMEPIPDVAALRPLLASLKQKGLIVSLTPEGRGHKLTHALYPPAEMERIRTQHGGPTGGSSAPPAEPTGPMARQATPAASSGADQPTAPTASQPVEQTIIDTLRRDIDQLRDHLTQLRDDVARLDQEQQETRDQVKRLRADLGEG